MRAMCAGSSLIGTMPRQAMNPVNSARSAPNSTWRMRECTPSAPTRASPRTVAPPSSSSVTLSSSCTNAPQRARQHFEQVRAVDGEVRRAVALDRYRSEVEELPGLAGLPMADFLALRLAGQDLQRFADAE